MKANYRTAILFAIVFLLIAGNASSADYNDVLQGIKSVRVYVLDSADKYGKISQLQQDVELKLRLAGIKVDSSSPQILGVDVLINEQTMQCGQNSVIGYYGVVQITLLDKVILSRNPRISKTTRIWQGELIMCHYLPKDFWERCREIVRDLTDEFINAYLSVNPK